MLRVCLTGILLTLICGGTVHAQMDWEGEFTITSSWNRSWLSMCRRERVTKDWPSFSGGCMEETPKNGESRRWMSGAGGTRL